MPKARKLRFPNSKGVNSYNQVTHAQRLECIYEHIIHEVQIKDLADRHCFSFNTVRNIVSNYKATGRTNRKINSRSELLVQKYYSQGGPLVRPTSKQCPASKPAHFQPSKLKSQPESQIASRQSSSSLGHTSQLSAQTRLSHGEQELASSKPNSGNLGAFLFTSETKEAPRVNQCTPPSRVCLLAKFHERWIGADQQRAGAECLLQEAGFPSVGEPHSLQEALTLESQPTTESTLKEYEIISSDIGVFRKETEERHELFTGPLAALNKVVLQDEPCMKRAPEATREMVKVILQGGRQNE